MNIVEGSAPPLVPATPFPSRFYAIPLLLSPGGFKKLTYKLQPINKKKLLRPQNAVLAQNNRGGKLNSVEIWYLTIEGGGTKSLLRFKRKM